MGAEVPQSSGSGFPVVELCALAHSLLPGYALDDAARRKFYEVLGCSLNVVESFPRESLEQLVGKDNLNKLNKWNEFFLNSITSSEFYSLRKRFLCSDSFDVEWLESILENCNDNEKNWFSSVYGFSFDEFKDLLVKDLLKNEEASNVVMSFLRNCYYIYYTMNAGDFGSLVGIISFYEKKMEKESGDLILKNPLYESISKYLKEYGGSLSEEEVETYAALLFLRCAPLIKPLTEFRMEDGESVAEKVIRHGVRRGVMHSHGKSLIPIDEDEEIKNDYLDLEFIDVLDKMNDNFYGSNEVNLSPLKELGFRIREIMSGISEDLPKFFLPYQQYKALKKGGFF